MFLHWFGHVLHAFTKLPSFGNFCCTIYLASLFHVKEPRWHQHPWTLAPRFKWDVGTMASSSLKLLFYLNIAGQRTNYYLENGIIYQWKRILHYISCVRGNHCSKCCSWWPGTSLVTFSLVTSVAISNATTKLEDVIITCHKVFKTQLFFLHPVLAMVLYFLTFHYLLSLPCPSSLTMFNET